jgi:hypothetical protein
MNVSIIAACDDGLFPFSDIVHRVNRSIGVLRQAARAQAAWLH